MKRIFTLFLIILSIQILSAEEIKDTLSRSVVTHKFGGNIDAYTYFDTHESVEVRNGLQYTAPKMRKYNSEGDNINAHLRLRMSASSTRFNYAINVTNILNGNLKGFIEIDFMGTSDNVLNTIRMRHAYIDIQWRNRGVRLGQTSHLTMVGEVTPNTVTYGGGYPLNPLNRPVQMKFYQRWGNYSQLSVAAAIFGQKAGEEQSYALLPDIQARIQSGNPDKLLYGAVIGVKSVKPRRLTDNELISKKRLTTFNAAVYARYKSRTDYYFRIYGLWGGNMSCMALLGGYAPKKSDSGKEDYGYTEISAVSAFFDIESPRYNGSWQWGIFMGIQQNLGSGSEIDYSRVNLSVSNYGLNQFWRVAPRVYYHCKKYLSFGLEYMINGADWAVEMNDSYKPINGTIFSNNHRITFLARFKF